MNFIRGVLVTLLFAGLLAFAFANDQKVVVNIGLWQPVMSLALVIIGSFLIGFLPVWLKSLADRGLLRRKVAKLEGQLGLTETTLAQAKTELLRPAGMPAGQPQTIPQPAPPPGT